MSKDKLLPISIFSLALAIVIAASIISNGIKNNGELIGSGMNQGLSLGLSNINTTIRDIYLNEEDKKTIFNVGDASVYLGISEERLMQIMNNEESKIPYVKVGGDFIFSKSALDRWIQESNFKM